MIRLPMLFCERSFGVFFFIWGWILILDSFISASHTGVFYGYLERHFPGWVWGLIMIIIGTCRWIAHRTNSTRWRLRLSFATFVLLSIISSVALLAQLWVVTAPLCLFITYISYWCHGAIVRDVRIGL